MIVEIALLTAKDGTNDEFREALRAARPVIATAPGYLRSVFHQGVEEPGSFILRIEWESLEAHLAFRATPLLAEWRELGTAPRRNTATTAEVLTAREREVLSLVAAGRTNRQIGQALFISGKTVKNHLASIYEKLDARDRTQAVLAAVRIGIIRLR